MPNWVKTRIIIEGDPEDIAELRAMFADGFSLNKITPLPDALKRLHIGACDIDGVRVHEWRTDEEGNAIALSEREKDSLIVLYGTTSWYEWSLKHWGVKWDARSNVPLFEEDDYLEYEIETPWDTPDPAFVALAKRFPGVYISTRISGEWDCEHCVRSYYI